MSNPATDRPRPVGRLAPSPTGLLHLGHARSFLLAWWHIRSRGGRILVRLEDLDGDRVKPDMCEAALRDLVWLGLDSQLGRQLRLGEVSDVDEEVVGAQVLA